MKEINKDMRTNFHWIQLLKNKHNYNLYKTFTLTKYFARTGKKIKSTKNSAKRDHVLVCNNIVSFGDFFVLVNGTNDFRIKLREGILIHLDGSQLNKISESAPLMLFF